MFLTVDLAAKFSAAVLRDESGKVYWQGDSGKDSPIRWVQRLGNLVTLCSERGHPIQHILVEDVPYGISSQAMVKPVLRLQGMLIHELGPNFYFISPSSWQKEYPGVGRAPKGLTKAQGDKYRIDKAAEYARELGYEPPDLVKKYIDSLPEGKKVLKKDTNPLEKAMTDYVDAFLMSDWLVRHKDEYTTLSGVQIAMI